LRLGLLALLAKRRGLLELRAGGLGLLNDPILIAAIAGNAEDKEHRERDDEDAIAIPQPFEPLAANFLVNFLKDIGHERRLRSSFVGEAGNLSIWRRQGKTA
jgi:hypothetical protein